jgi:hypothetical protein
LEQGQEKLRRDYLAQLRDQRIEDRQSEWMVRNTEDILAKVSRNRTEEADRHEMFKRAQKARQEELKEAPRLKAEAEKKQRELDKKRDEMAMKKEHVRLIKEMKRLNQWKQENARKTPDGPNRKGPIRSVLAAPRTTSANPLDQKRAENIELRESIRKDRFEEHQQVVNQIPATTFTGTTEQALISGAMSVFWHAKSTSGRNQYDVYGADDPEDGEGEENPDQGGASSPNSPPLSP